MGVSLPEDEASMRTAPEKSDLSFTTTGVTLGAQSDNNVFRKNNFSTVNDAGTGNRFKGNVEYPDSCT
jgi:hypothetical protein